MFCHNFGDVLHLNRLILLFCLGRLHHREAEGAGGRKLLRAGVLQLIEADHVDTLGLAAIRPELAAAGAAAVGVLLAELRLTHVRLHRGENLAGFRRETVIAAEIACTGALLNLMIDPWKALLCILVYLVVQFIEGHFIYPKVVGNSVGLSSFWVLVAVLVGQNLFGVFGMILFIPLTSVIYTLLKNDTNRKLKKKAELAQETVGTDSEPHQTE